jgi:hypothetical protein
MLPKAGRSCSTRASAGSTPVSEPGTMHSGSYLASSRAAAFWASTRKGTADEQLDERAARDPRGGRGDPHRATDDGDPGADVPVWVVRVGDDLYVRSVKGRAGRWYQHLARSHHGRVSAGGLQCEVRVEDPGVAVNAEIDAAYAEKYGRWGDRYIEAMTTPDVTSTTLRLLPG